MFFIWRVIYVIIWIYCVVIKCFDFMSNFNFVDGYLMKVVLVCNMFYVYVFFMFLWNLVLDL